MEDFFKNTQSFENYMQYHVLIIFNLQFFKSAILAVITG